MNPCLFYDIFNIHSFIYIQEGPVLTEEFIRETEEFVLRTGRLVCLALAHELRVTYGTLILSRTKSNRKHHIFSIYLDLSSSFKPIPIKMGLVLCYVYGKIGKFRGKKFEKN